MGDDTERILANHRDHAPSPVNGTLNRSYRHMRAHNEEGYEEFFKESEPCPTCRGLGRVPKEQKNSLVALIPLKDKRLKPRRTALYVCITVFVCVLVAGLILFFLFPRDVSVKTNLYHLKPIYIDIDTKNEFVNLTVVNAYNFSNSNYFPIQVTGARMVSLYDNRQITTAVNTSSLELQLRSSGTYHIEMNFIFKKGNDWGFLVAFCDDSRSWVHNLPISFQLTANYSYLGHIEQTTLQTFQPVTCFNETQT